LEWRPTSNRRFMSNKSSTTASLCRSG
jgi:hypothetical protein